MAYRKGGDKASLPLLVQINIPGLDHSWLGFLAKIHGTGTVVIFIEAELLEGGPVGPIGKLAVIREVAHMPVVLRVADDGYLFI